MAQFDGYTTRLAERAVIALERIAACMESGVAFSGKVEAFEFPTDEWARLGKEALRKKGE